MLVNNGAVNPALVQLAREARIWGLDFAPAPQEMSDLLQQFWMKAKDGKLRAELEGRFPNEREQELLNELGAVAIVPPILETKYNGTLVLGARLKAVVRRVCFMHMVEGCYDRQMPQPVCLLGSNRLLSEKQEMPGHVPAILQKTGAEFDPKWRDEQAFWPVTEWDMTARVYKWIYPRDTSQTPFVFCAPDVVLPGGTTRPADTAATVKQWLTGQSVAEKIDVNPGHYLVVSSQPFCEGQLLAVRRAVKEAGKEGYTFDVCGPATPKLELSKWLDNLAKQLYEEVQLISAARA